MEILIVLLIAAAACFALRHMKKHPGCAGQCAGCTMECKHKKP